MSKKENAFKTYVMKEYVNGFGVEREIQIALKEELDSERADNVKLLPAMNTKQLHKYIKKNKILHKMLTQTAFYKNAIFKPGLVQRLKGLVS